MAQRAAQTYYQAVRGDIWRRLVTIAFEDIGAADIAAVVETVDAATAPRRGAKQGNGRDFTRFVSRLAEARKDRSADYLVCAAKFHAGLEVARERCRSRPAADSLDLVADRTRFIAFRSVAACHVAGLDWATGRSGRPLALEGLAEVYRGLGVAEEVIRMMVLALRKSRDPMAIVVPLIWTEANQHGAVGVCDDPIPASGTIDGVPLYAFDKHTRIGKRAIAILVHGNDRIEANGQLRDCLEQFVPRTRWKAAVEMAVFYADGSPIARRLEWPLSRPLEVLGMEADFTSVGVPPEGIAPLREAMAAAFRHLNQIRRSLWFAGMGRAVPGRLGLV
jgi:hypothetical protein